VYGYFSVIQETACVKVAIATLNQLYDTFGDINDDIVAYQFYVENKVKNILKKSKKKLGIQ
jgi:hypothetical protein